MIPYGLPLIYSTVTCDTAPSVRLFRCLSRPLRGGHFKEKRHIMTTKTLSKSDLAQFTGSDNWYRHSINRNVLYTDGAKHVAEHGGAYWLLDEIAIIQPYNKKIEYTDFPLDEITLYFANNVIHLPSEY
jgi:hypothetical protein